MTRGYGLMAYSVSFALILIDSMLILYYIFDETPRPSSESILKNLAVLGLFIFLFTALLSLYLERRRYNPKGSLDIIILGTLLILTGPMVLLESITAGVGIILLGLIVSVLGAIRLGVESISLGRSAYVLIIGSILFLIGILSIALMFLNGHTEAFKRLALIGASIGLPAYLIGFVVLGRAINVRYTNYDGLREAEEGDTQLQ